MTTDLATSGTGTANPGSFYGRAGPGPQAVLSAAEGAERAAYALRAALGSGGPDAPLPAYLEPARHIRGAGQTLRTGLFLEADLAAMALTADLAIPEPAAAGQARGHLLQAAGHAGEAGTGVAGAWRILRKLTRVPDADAAPGQLGKAAAAAETAAISLGGQLRLATRQPTPAALPMIAGHGQVANYIALALIDLSVSCAALADIIEQATPRPARTENQAAGPLRDAAESFRLGCDATTRACHVLRDAAEIIRKAPPGFPCASCGGTAISRLTRSGCLSCRGSGIDVRAMRPVTDY